MTLPAIIGFLLLIASLTFLFQMATLRTLSLAEPEWPTDSNPDTIRAKRPDPV